MQDHSDGLNHPGKPPLAIFRALWSRRLWFALPPLPASFLARSRCVVSSGAPLPRPLPLPLPRPLPRPPPSSSSPSHAVRSNTPCPTAATAASPYRRSNTPMRFGSRSSMTRHPSMASSDHPVASRSALRGGLRRVSASRANTAGELCSAVQRTRSTASSVRSGSPSSYGPVPTSATS